MPKRPSVGRQWRGVSAARRCAVRRGATAGAQCGRHGGDSDKCCGRLWDTPVATGAASSGDGRGGAGRPAASRASPLAGGAGRGVGSSHGARRCPHFSSCFLALPLCACVGPPCTCSRCSAGAPAAAARSADPRPSTAAGVSGRWRRWDPKEESPVPGVGIPFSLSISLALLSRLPGVCVTPRGGAHPPLSYPPPRLHHVLRLLRCGRPVID